MISQKDGIANSQPTLFSYDDTSTEGRTIVEVTNRNGKERTNVFNESRQLIEVTDENGNTTSYTYDENGNVTSVTDGEDHTEQLLTTLKTNLLWQRIRWEILRRILTIPMEMSQPLPIRMVPQQLILMIPAIG